ncbi:MAG TPA: VTT domain-containing protein [Candidatus Saccharimonadales bacterium]|nr:VTT domain-containing protein [Candidatus Saccharimonadales bacterium]
MFSHLLSTSTLFSALLGIDVQSILSSMGVLGVLLVIFAESGLLIGFFLPGDSLLFTAGFLVNVGILHFNIHALVALLFVAAVLGDSVGYTFGRRIGRRLFTRPNSRLFKQENIQRAEAFYEKYGGKTIIIARFIPVVRTFAPIVAGVGKMNYTTFLAYNLIGGILWAGGITYLGYFLGSWFTSLGLDIDQVILPVVALIILISIAPALIHLLKDKEQRATFWDATKRELAGLFKRR